MRPTHAYTHAAPVHSRPDSRASSHSSSPAATPSRTRADKARTRPANNAASSTAMASGRKSSNQRKSAQAKSQQQSQQQRQSTSTTPDASVDDFSKISSQDMAAAQPASQVPGLLSLSKPLSELQDDSSAGFSPAKGKKARSDAANKRADGGQQRNRQQRSASPPTDAAATTTAKNAHSGGAKGASRSARRNNRGGADRADASVDLLSKSAPSASLAHAKSAQKGAKAVEAAVATVAEPSSGLTWQQEMLGFGSGTLGSKASADLRKTGSSGGGSNKRHVTSSIGPKHDGVLAQPQQIQISDSSALTWQQEQFGGAGGGGAKRRNGPQYDVFADARDAETFGGGSGCVLVEGKTRRRARAGSVGSGPSAAVAGKAANAAKASARGKQAGGGSGGDVPLHIDDLFNSSSDHATSGKNHRRGQSAAVSFASVENGLQQQPSTPAKKPHHHQPQQQQQSGQHPSVAAAIAYAGPNFHNSPSPASLPAPKFSTRMNKVDNGSGSIPPSSLGAGSGSGSGSSSSGSGSEDDEYEARRTIRSTTAPAEIHLEPPSPPAPAAVAVAAKEVPAAHVEAKKTIEPGATVESLLVRMMGGVKFSV
ncbi:uncharacterized protein PSFLO_06146 [Pseudozyma flocculosa]|uniref:Uncharacterized protein n=1 Tax=Pseudozyma flocculosa TaxID=84751 RepID=A0A5C3F872_9BASI|nr:uncharacterized protein PSFLO_06146 [Pseudozyma flocculosa]